MTRDERARRELADKVKDAADAGMGEMVAALRTAAFIDDDRQSFTAAMDAAKASAQEASGLRAWTPCRKDGCPGMEWHEGEPSGCGHPTITEGGCEGKASAQIGKVAPTRNVITGEVVVHRDRLANVQGLLATYVAAVEIGDRDAEMGAPDGDVVAALAELRAILGGGL